MLNRRFLRIKVMQALYGFFQEEKGDLKKAEKELLLSIDNIYNLYLYLLALLKDVHDYANTVIIDSKNKKLPTKADLNPNVKFVENQFLVAASKHKALQQALAKRKVSWDKDADLVRKIFNDIRLSDEYKAYMEEGARSGTQDKEFVLQILLEILAEHDMLTSWFEERSIHWADDLFVAIIGVKKTIESFDGETFYLQNLYKNEAEDVEFVKDLFTKCVVHHNEFSEMISDKTTNWEVERIAQMDVLLMKMALTEVMYFPNVPIKVSLNEYIDISKEYSTPKSKVFINGILDKIVLDLKNSQKIVKSGRGLQEN
jgi:transcription antitermination protein NusB